MKKILLASALSAALFAFSAGAAFADTVGPISFESPAYTLGVINGQQGWSATGSAGSGCATYDEGVSGSMGVTGFGSQSFRISDAVTSGCFSDQAFTPALVNPAGEASADNAAFGGTIQSHFEAQFDIAAISGDSDGSFVSVSPDRGDGSRMSYLRFEYHSTGINVFFDDVTDPTHAQNADSFNETQIATLNPSVPHTIKFTMDFNPGPDNDVVQIYIDGTLVHTGTTWEDYYRYDTESNPSAPSDYTRTVRTVLFKEGGTAVPADSGKGFLIDNLSLESGATPTSPSETEVCSTVNLTSGTGTQTAGYTESTISGPSDGLNANNYSDEGLVPSFLTPTSVIPPWVDPTSNATFAGSGAAWVSSASNWPGDVGGEGSPGNDQWRLFAQGFTLPAGAIATSSEVWFTADNAAEVYLNSDLSPIGMTSSPDFVYGAPDASNDPFYSNVYNATFTPTTGYNTLSFVVRNWGGAYTSNPTGLLYKAVVNYCVPPTLGSLTVTKDTTGGNGTFNFTGTNGIGSFSITTTGGAGTDTFSNLTPGSYSVTETAATGWTMNSNTCSNVMVSAGGAATCTIKNSKNSTVTVTNNNHATVTVTTTSSSNSGGNVVTGNSNGGTGNKGGNGGSTTVKTGKSGSSASSITILNTNVTKVKKH